MILTVTIAFILFPAFNAGNLVVFTPDFNITKISHSGFLDIPFNYKMLRDGHVIKNASYEYLTKRNLNDKYFTKWKNWTDCYECGTISLRYRTGQCYQKPFYSKNENFERVCEKLPGETSIIFQNLTQYENCFVECPNFFEYPKVKEINKFQKLLIFKMIIKQC